MKVFQLAYAKDAAADFKSLPLELGDFIAASIHVKFTATSASCSGTVSLEATDDDVGSLGPDACDWVAVASSSQAIANAASHLWNITSAGYRWVRVSWDCDSALTGKTWALAPDNTTCNYARLNNADNCAWTRVGDQTGATYTSLGTQPWVCTVTSNAHGMASGASVTVSGGTNVSGAKTITKTGANTFTFSVIAGDPTAASTLSWTRSAAGCAWTSNNGSTPYTVTVTDVGHGVATGGTITVSAGSDGDVDGSRVVTRINNDSFRFTTVGDPTRAGTLSYTMGAAGDAYAANNGSAPFLAVITSVAHNLATGASVVLTLGDANLNGTRVATRTGPDTFSVAPAASPARSGTVTWAVGQAGVAYTSVGSDPYTITVAAANHGLQAGCLITVGTATNAGALTASAAITLLSEDEFTYVTTGVGDPGTGTLTFTTGGVGKAYVGSGSSPWLVTVTTAAPHYLDTVSTLTISAGTSGNVDGSRTGNYVGALSFAFYVTADPGASGTLTWANASTAVVYAAVGSTPWSTTVTSVAHKIDAAGQAVVISAGGAALNACTVATVTTDDAFTLAPTSDPGASGTLTWTQAGASKAYVSDNGSTPWLVTATSAAHGYVNSDTVTISGGSSANVDGAQVVTKLSATQYTFSVAADPTRSGTLNQAGVFVQVTKTGHGLSASNVITVAGTTDAAIDGAKTLTSAASTTFQFKCTTSPGSTGASNLDYYGPTFIVEVTKTTHGLLTGATVFVSNASDTDAQGKQSITKTGDNTFTYVTAANPGASGTLDYSVLGWKVSVTSTTHTLIVGDLVTISASGVTIFNGAQTVATKADGNTFAYYVDSATYPSATSGTLTYAYTGYMTITGVLKESTK